MATLKYSNGTDFVIFWTRRVNFGQWYNPIRRRFDISRGYTRWQFMIAEIQYGPPIQ